jgi:hypothetical protein
MSSCMSTVQQKMGRRFAASGRRRFQTYNGQGPCVQGGRGRGHGQGLVQHCRDQHGGAGCEHGYHHGGEVCHGSLNNTKWLREKECPWGNSTIHWLYEDTFSNAAN